MDIQKELEEIKELSNTIWLKVNRIQGQANLRSFVPQVTCIEILGLSNRAVNCLIRNRIQTVEQLAQISKTELLKMRNVGKHTANEITERLKAFGFKVLE